ncbi:MAG: hypothetical protein SPF94_00410 [Desulfovibrio sp.]|nr:hypothetical protein [Desulfovibrio sp.]
MSTTKEPQQKKAPVIQINQEVLRDSLSGYARKNPENTTLTCFLNFLNRIRVLPRNFALEKKTHHNPKNLHQKYRNRQFLLFKDLTIINHRYPSPSNISNP